MFGSGGCCPHGLPWASYTTHLHPRSISDETSESTEHFFNLVDDVPIFYCWNWCLRGNLVLERAQFSNICWSCTKTARFSRSRYWSYRFVLSKRWMIVFVRYFACVCALYCGKQRPLATWRSGTLRRSLLASRRHIKSVVNVFGLGVWFQNNLCKNITSNCSKINLFV